ncbi:unnamed protein product [Trifolium pratense]|uniref:Uncharacterized protein n=1 Tax=Trifolium pratense TaxID=57577 RepID=A0ACB0MDH7_TRIPR|nr:unnamed protein product [Trifolium pratense]
MAIKEATEEMIQRGLSHVIFESDSKIVVDAISSRQIGTSEFSMLISCIKSLLLLNPSFEVKFVKRQGSNASICFILLFYSRVITKREVRRIGTQSKQISCENDQRNGYNEKRCGGSELARMIKEKAIIFP